MTSPDADLADAIHRVRERAILQAMALCTWVQPDPDHLACFGSEGPEVQALRYGHTLARWQLYDELERMIAREAATAAAAFIRETTPPPTRDDDGGC